MPIPCLGYSSATRVPALPHLRIGSAYVSVKRDFCIDVSWGNFLGKCQSCLA